MVREQMSSPLQLSLVYQRLMVLSDVFFGMAYSTKSEVILTKLTESSALPFKWCSVLIFIHLSRDMRFQKCGMCDQQSLRSACAYAQSDPSLC